MVESCSQPLLSVDFYDKQTPERPSTTLELLWQGICHRYQFNLNNKYPSRQSAFFAFMQTLSNGCTQAAGHEYKLYHEILKDIWLQMAVRYIVDTFNTADIVSDDIRELVKLTEPEDGYSK